MDRADLVDAVDLKDAAPFAGVEGLSTQRKSGPRFAGRFLPVLN